MSIEARAKRASQLYTALYGSKAEISLQYKLDGNKSRWNISLAAVNANGATIDEAMDILIVRIVELIEQQSKHFFSEAERLKGAIHV